MSEEQSIQTEEPVQVVKRGRGRPPLTDEQRLERDRKRYEQQHQYYIANKERINENQKKLKTERYKNDETFRKKAIDYITMYNKRRAAIVNFATAFAAQNEGFRKQMHEYLFKEVGGDD